MEDPAFEDGYLMPAARRDQTPLVAPSLDTSRDVQALVLNGLSDRSPRVENLYRYIKHHS